MTILLISIVLLAFVRYGMSYRRKKLKDNNELSEEQQRITSSSNSVNQVGTTSVITHINAYDRPSIDLDLPAAYSLDDRPSGYLT
ncbi:hypothetical protein AB6A40_010931 [Gnathostoma spinigerum]|uniref:Uncharacterized protein n=1 Tax=Gnathostoma spinigerum TaxID=75299 RepID=A0ABD6EYQ9_9BILA